MALNGLSLLPQSIAGLVDFEIDQIRVVIADYVGVSVKQVIDDAHFCDDLGLDWLERLELVLRIEEEMGIEISESDATRIENVGNLLRHIEFAIKNQKGVASRARKNNSPAITRFAVGDTSPRSWRGATGNGGCPRR